jgi:hypothetical protein
MKYKSLIYGLVFLLGFYLGSGFSNNRGIKEPYEYKVREGFYRNPYALRIVRKEVCGEVEVYLYDIETGESKRIGPNMYLGGLEDRMKSLISLPFETRDNLLNQLIF